MELKIMRYFLYLNPETMCAHFKKKSIHIEIEHIGSFRFGKQ